MGLIRPWRLKTLLDRIRRLANQHYIIVYFRSSSPMTIHLQTLHPAGLLYPGNWTRCEYLSIHSILGAAMFVLL
jgi:hypothetical protein